MESTIFIQELWCIKKKTNEWAVWKSEFLDASQREYKNRLALSMV